jgi:hypothetical protein
VTVRRSVLVFAAAVAAAAAHVWWSAGVLPEQVAGHFDGGGAADGWSSRETFLLGYAGTVALLAVLLGGLAALLPRLPAGAFNLPDRDYWLAPERAAVTRLRVADWLLEYGAVTVLFMAAVFHLSVRANLGDGEPRLGPAFGLLVAAYLAGTGVAVIRLLLAFRRPRGDAG